MQKGHCSSSKLSQHNGKKHQSMTYNVEIAGGGIVKECFMNGGLLNR